jgi:transcriptional regulator with XRE-family HTH domain
MDLKSHIGVRIKSARKLKGLTQEELAAAVGKAVETISNIERGYVLTGLETLENIGASLDKPLTYFVDGYGKQRRLSRTRLEREQEIARLCEQMNDDTLQLARGLLTVLSQGKKRS